MSIAKNSRYAPTSQVNTSDAAGVEALFTDAVAGYVASTRAPVAAQAPGRINTRAYLDARLSKRKGSILANVCYDYRCEALSKTGTHWLFSSQSYRVSSVTRWGHETRLRKPTSFLSGDFI